MSNLRDFPAEIGHRDLMLAAGEGAILGVGGIYELKYGFQCLVIKQCDEVRLLSRNGNDMASRFPQIVAELRTLDRGRSDVDGLPRLLAFGGVFGCVVVKLLDRSAGRCAEKPKALTAESARCSCPRIRLQHIPRICETAPDSAGRMAVGWA